MDQFTAWDADIAGPGTRTSWDAILGNPAETRWDVLPAEISRIVRVVWSAVARRATWANPRRRVTW